MKCWNSALNSVALSSEASTQASPSTARRFFTPRSKSSWRSSVGSVGFAMASLLGQPARQHLVDPLAVEVDDLEAPMVPLHRVGGLGETAEQQHDHPGQRVVAAAVFFGQLLQAEPVFQLGH